MERNLNEAMGSQESQIHWEEKTCRSFVTENGKLQGVIRETAGREQRLYDSADDAVATYRRDGYTYNRSGIRIGSGNRLAGMIGEDEE